MSGEQLERRYRRLLRILVPKLYREARGEELLSVLMESAVEGRQWPDLRETLSMARLGMRARLGAAEGAQTVSQTSAIARAVAITGTLLLSFVGAIQLAQIEGNLTAIPNSHVSLAHPFSVALGKHEFSIAYAEVPAMWLAVLALIAFGWWRAARALAVVVLVLSLFQTHGTETALQQETLLAAVVTVAMFAVRGAHARSARVPGLVGLAVTIGLAAWVKGEFGGVRSPGRPVLRVVGDLQAWGVSDDHHVLAAAVLAVAVVGAVAFRSVVWPVAVAVVAFAALAPVVLRGAVDPPPGYDQVPLAFLACALVVVAGLAVARDRLAGRRGGIV